jgi:DASH family cryptochrome
MSTSFHSTPNSRMGRGHSRLQIPFVATHSVELANAETSSDDLPFENVEDTPDVFTTYKKMLDPLRDAPRPLLPTISLRDSGLPPLPPKSMIPEQHLPFVIPESYAELESALIAPLHEPEILNPPQMPPNTQSGHPFHGGATAGHARIKHLLESSAMSKYKDTRNGMLGLDYATKLSGWLSIGCISARQLHYAMRDFEDGVTDVGRDASGYGQGENRGTLAVRYELIWRDFMRLCSRKWGDKLFNVTGYIGDHSQEWTYMPKPHEAAKRRELERFLEGTTGMGLIDASQRELYLTGYTSNRARQNVASFLAKHLKFDWRIGAEWYECMLVDYDMSSNWGNWQYVSGVGCDPRGYRVFNPVKQAYDYDSKAEYVKAWVPELGGLETPGHCFQAWTTPPPLAAEQGLTHLEWVKEPLKKIKFIVGPGRHAGRHSGGSNGGGEQFRGQGARQRERQRAMELANHITVIPYRPRGVGSGGGEPHSPAGSSNSGHSFQDLQQIRGVHSGRGRQGSWDGTAAAIHSLGRSGSWDGSAAGYYGERQGSWDGSIGSNDGGRQGSWNGSIPVTGGDRGRGGFRGRGRAGEGSWRRGGGREARMGHMDRDAAARSPDGGVYF